MNATLPQQPQPDLSGLRAAIAAAESEPDYIKNDSAVAAALNQAKAVVAQTNPSQTDVQNATNNLNSAVAAAKQKEQNAQAAAETAVAAAENSKRPSDITAAQAKVNAVQDPAKKASLQSRLNAVSSAITSALLALNSLIATAKDPATIAGMSSSSVAALQSQIAVAEAVANNANSSVTELDNARTALQAKIDALQSDTSALQSAISAAEAEPAYIKNDTAVAAALSQAKSVVAQTNPSQTDIQNATNNLNNAVASAKQKEQSAQAAAEAAVAKAEADKTQTAIDAAKILVDKVQDPVKKAALQARLDAIVVTPAPNPPTPPNPNPNPNPDPNPDPTAPITSATIPQPHGASVTISTSGDACYNLASAKVATAPSRHNGRILRDVADFTIDCTNQTAATGFTTQVTLTLSRRYSNTERLTIAKIANGSFKQDITSQVAFGTTSDGKYTTITYSLTDGGFGDEDNAANGTIVDPVGVYEEEGPLADNVNTLAKTGENIVLLVAGAILLGSGGFWIAKRELW